MRSNDINHVQTEYEDDTLLVARAKDGDGYAFGELVRKHRGKVYGWAKAVVGDPHLAEDVAQEAVMRSFLRIGTLADAGRFLPWLHRIVRNQAFRSLRRSGRYGKELPISAFASDDRDSSEAWPAMTPSAIAASSREDDPCELLLRREVLSTIAEIVQRLSPTERAVFEAHVFQELTAQEIARFLSMSTASVYMSLSRSRKKLHNERVREHFAIQGGKEFSMYAAKRAVLSKPAILHSRIGLYNESIRNCIYYALPYVGKGHLGYDEAMALTGHAFQINVEEQTVDTSGVFMYGETTMFPNSMLNLGLHSSLIDKFGYEKMPEGPLKEELYTLTIDMIRGSVDRGVPAIFSGGVNTQFALYYGYDDGRQTFFAVDTLTEMEIPYSTFRNRHLYGFVIEEEAEMDERESFRRMLAMAVMHGRGKEPTFSGYVNGLAAYDSWIRAFEHAKADPAGNAACMRNVGDMRGYAASFLRKKRMEWESDASSDQRSISLLREASARYDEVAGTFRSLKTLFPYPAEGDIQRDAAVTAAQLLRQAKTAEDKGLHALEELLQLLCGERPAPGLIKPNPLWVL
ncbi:RNA polymerase sigma factor [Paenibacillus thermotolerans]|uniref:RNA polymerase sigma factor n=1 Tax=Paenibacillus thermotolerans TaxID=3027807 RepID=UPI0023679192|nr:MULTISPECIES: RNA polymerase sigma factor [unclassified Paenibacillus]